jgi:two-component system, OmpR family, osmolarity sensor histidine kinase EnvZ
VGIVIEDQGPAMSEEEIERAFDPHFRGAAAQHSDAPGAGLGLTIAQRILRAHGGSVEIGLSTLGGLRVCLLLPEYDAAAAPADAAVGAM